ncbi:hypothetical protein Ddc_14627 [Ditylenchus destructor]|nr:hypothetical protein Ddc_14627 [Ditylenchus destructor]
MASLVIELSDFNNRLNEEFTADQFLKAEEGKVITSVQVLAYFKSYTRSSFGYPDADYLDRVRDELTAVGVHKDLIDDE